MASLKLESHLCVYCCKPATFTEINTLDENITIHKRFLNLLSKHFTIKVRKLPCTNCCDDCLGILKTFCELYHQIKCLELKLNWQVDKLLNIMKWADRVPSRLKCFKTTDNFDNKVKFRKDLKRKCKRYMSRIFPRVSISILQPSVVPKIESVVSTEECNEEVTTDELEVISITAEDNSANICINDRNKKEHFLLGWITTLSALLCLSQLQIPKSNQTQDEPVVESIEVNNDDISEVPQISPVFQINSPSTSYHYDHCDDDFNSPEKLENVHIDQDQDSSRAGVDIYAVKEEKRDNIQLPPTTNSYFKTPLSPVVNAPELLSVLLRSERGTEIKSINASCLQAENTNLVLPHFPETSIICSLSEPEMLPNIIPEDNHILKQLLSDSYKPINLPNTSASINENTTPSIYPAGRRNLRTRHQCANCKATFSDVNRFESHQHECLSINDIESDSYSENGDSPDNVEFTTANETNTDGESKSSSENSSDEEFEHTNSPLKRKERNNLVLRGRRNRSGLNCTRTKTQRKRNTQVKTATSTNLYVCTRCTPNMSFHTNCGLKYHDYYKHSNGRIAIDKEQVSKPDIKYIHMEGLSIKTKYTCSNLKCGKIFYLPQELENHMKLHGSFACSVCDFSANHALKLIDHELEHSNQNQKLANPDFKIGEIFACAKCDFKSYAKKEVVNHSLDKHLMIPIIKSKCPICQQEFLITDRVPLVHFINCHDLNRLDDPNSKIVCTEPDCSAYFLTEDQLHVHFNRQHVAGCTSEESTILMNRKIAKRRKQVDREKRNHKNHACSHCTRRFLYRGNLKTHIIRSHANKMGYKHVAGALGNYIISKEGITINDVVLEENAQYFCKVENCQEKFRKKEDFEIHSKLHGEFACNFCQVVKSFAVDLALHETIHVTENDVSIMDKLRLKVYKCSRCPFRSGRRKRYVEHFLRKHLNLKMDRKECPICKHVFETETYKKPVHIKSLKTEVHRHFINWHDFTDVEGGEDKGAKKCDKCPAYFRTKLQLLYHKDDVHNTDKSQCEDVWSNVCSDCGKAFSDITSLRAHRLAHKVELRFKCEITGCSKKFETIRELMHHDLLNHRNKEMFICSDCGRRFFSNSALTGHKKTHEVKVIAKTVKKTHVCELCGKSFINRQKLEQHYTFHEDPQNWEFECVICKKKLSAKQKLNEHMRTHTKEKPFVCQVCGVAYAHRHNLRIHVNSKHKEVEEVASKRVSANFASWRKGKKLK